MTKRIAIICAALVIVAAPPARAQCELSAGFDNSVAIIEGDLEVVFGADGTLFGPDDTVNFELIVKNNGATPVQIPFPVHYPQAVMVADATCTDVVACMDAFAFVYPPSFFYTPGSVDIAAGACERWTIAWDLAADPAPVGDYKAFAGLFAWTDGQDRLPLGEWILPAGGATVTFELTDVVSNAAVSWSGIKALYR